MARFIALALALVTAVFGKTQWYAMYDLSDDQINMLTKNNCYRGVYGGTTKVNTERTLSLFTCPLFSDSQPFAELDDEAFLCVVELANSGDISAVNSMLTSHNTDVLFAGRQELVIASTSPHSVRPDMCCPTHYNGLVDNTLYVPQHPIAEQMTPPVDHPAFIKSMTKGLGNFEADPYIQQLINAYSREQVLEQVTNLSTGFDRTNTRITRNSYAIAVGRAGCADGTWNCANHATRYVVDSLNSMFANYPGAWRVTTNTFRADMCDNVILELTGTVNPSKYILTGAHLDSRNTGSGPTATGIAPGADDNASGSAVHLELARIIAVNRVRFENSIRLMWFCGEEQGLLGSAALALAYQNERLDVVGMFNMDMIGYTNPPNGVVLSFMTGSATRWLSESCQAFSQTYIPSLAVGFTQACCSDQQSFFARGFPAAGIFETPTPRVVYPAYHMTTDQYNNGLINYEQVWRFGQAISACALEYAIPIRTTEAHSNVAVQDMNESA